MNDIKELFLKELGSASTAAELDRVRVGFLGKKGLLTEKLKTLKDMPPEERRSFGQSVNELKDFISAELESKSEDIKASELGARLSKESIDITLPGSHTPLGSEHPVYSTMQEIIDIFVSMGFSIEEGPEIELDHYNFESLNIPKDHPARDMQDTFYISDDVLLRTHTSPVQIRTMEKSRPPLRIIAPGKVYRCDADVSHTPLFHQVEGLMVDTDISFSHLKGVLETFIHRVFSPETPVRFRPSFFPFTEPSAEVDIGCVFCMQKSSTCSVCKGTGWIEILGAGMVHPKVFEMVGYDPEVYSGFAFGMGMERITMLKHSIDDIRMLFENDVRFLRQF